MFEPSRIELSKRAYKFNLRFIREQLKPGVRYCSVVKGNAYGHGLTEFVDMARDCKVDYFAVYSADEAFRIKQHSPGNYDLIVMGMADGDALEWCIEHGVELFVFDWKRFLQCIKIAKRLQKKAKIHFEMETGMNRTGFDSDELLKLSEWIHHNRAFIELKGICTHFAGAESLANDFRVTRQYQRFTESILVAKSHGLIPQYVHSACSAAAINYPHTQEDLVRIGIMQYGFWPNMETFVRFTGDESPKDNILKRIISWKSTIMSIKAVKKGEFIGYSTSFLAHNDMKIAVVPVGYAWGYARSLSNSGRVLIRGKYAPVTGIVNMNAISVDVSHIPYVSKGDEVILIGNQKDKKVSVASFGELSNQLNYELLTRLPLDIPRRVVD
jgi:alanine racemase